MSVVTQIQIRRGTASQWTSANPTLAAGEWGFETDTKKGKIGDGTTAWNSLAYVLGVGDRYRLIQVLYMLFLRRADKTENI